MMGRTRIFTTAAATFTTLIVANCSVPYQKARFTINGGKGFHVFAVTVEKTGMVHTHYVPIRLQHVVSGADGGFTVFVPAKGERYFTELYVSKRGFRFEDLTITENTLETEGSRAYQIKVRRATSALEERTAVFDLGNARHLNDACPRKKWAAQCRAYKRHTAARARYYTQRYPKGYGPHRPPVVGRVPVVADWLKLRPLRFPTQVVTAGEHIVALERYTNHWYEKKYGPPAKDLMYLRDHPRLRRNENLVVLSGAGKVLFETELAGTAWPRILMATMSAHQVALLYGNGNLRVFDVKTRRLGAPVRLEQAGPTPDAFAISPAADTVFVVYKNSVLHQYDGAGRLLYKGRVKGLFAARKLAITPSKGCLIAGKLEWNRAYRDFKVGNLWVTNMQTGVLRVSRGKPGWSVSLFALSAPAMWATDQGVWIYRQKLVPHWFHALPSEERSARHIFSDYRHRLYLYAYDGTLLRSVDQSDVICPRAAKPVPPHKGAVPARKGLITTRYLGNGHCGTIDRILLRAGSERNRATGSGGAPTRAPRPE